MFPVQANQILFFHKKGYLIIENFVQDLSILRKDCEDCVAKTVANDSNNILKCSMMEAFSKIAKTRGCIIEPLNLVGISPESRTNRNAYLSLRSSCLPHTSEASEILFGQAIKSVIKQLLPADDTIYLLNEQYVVKPPNSNESIFDYHQDSEYMPSNKVPYVSCWIALDNMSEENGTLYIVPYPKNNPDITKLSSLEGFLNHHLTISNQYESKEFYEENSEEHIEDGIEIPILVPAGSLVVLSSFVLHRSSRNTANKARRAYLPQYSVLPIVHENGDPLAFAVPL